MNFEYEKKYHALEVGNWWFVARRKEVIRHLEAAKDARILDIGCASGVLLKTLSCMGYTNTRGIDISTVAVKSAKAWGMQVEIMDGARLTFSEKFDCIIASDCLEHIENDTEALKSWHDALNQGGRAIVYVPAFMSLWSYHDVLNHHYRRYTLRELTERMESAGFTIVKKGYWNKLLFPLAYFRKGGIKETGGLMHLALLTLLSLEKYIPVPWGISCFAIGEKK